MNIQGELVLCSIVSDTPSAPSISMTLTAISSISPSAHSADVSRHGSGLAVPAVDQHRELDG